MSRFEQDAYEQGIRERADPITVPATPFRWYDYTTDRFVVAADNYDALAATPQADPAERWQPVVLAATELNRAIAAALAAEGERP